MASKKTVSVTEAARFRQCSPAAVRQLLIGGRLPGAKKVAGRWLINLAELERYYALVDLWRNRHRSTESVPDQKSEEEYLAL